MSKVFQQAANAAKNAAKNAGGGPSPPGSGPNMGSSLVSAVIGLGLLAAGGYNSLYTVEGGHRAVMFNRLVGVKDTVTAEGTHFMVPWFDMPIIFDIRTRPRNIQSLTGSKDLQMVNITLRVLSKPDPNQLPFIYRRLGQDYDERVLPSIVNEVLKQVVANYNASQLLTQRDVVSRQIRDHLVGRARDFNILLDDVSITHLTFSKEYTAAIEAKQVAQQEAERARFLVERALQDKKSTIIRAEGEALAAEMVGRAVAQNPGFIQLRRLDVAREIASTVSGSQNKVFLNSESLLLNLMDNKPLQMGAAPANK